MIDRIAEPWGARTPYAAGEPWPDRVDSYLADGVSEADVDRWAQSASVLHSNCEGYGKDMLTGGAVEADEYRALNPDGKAMLRGADYSPPHERPDGADELWLITGRTLYQFHTRTKTARVPQLNDAAPDVWVELSAEDAARLDISENDLVELRSPRGAVRARARICDIRPAVAFLPFHYGYWDSHGKTRHRRAANELTITEWDPVSKQPLFKTAAVRVAKVAGAQ